MVELPSTWIQHFGVDLVAAFPPELGARFRYFERVRPQPSFAAIANQVLTGDPEFTVHHIGEMVRVVTREGEYGAWVRIDGGRDGARAMHVIGAVFLDDFATVLDGVAVIAAHFATVEQLSLQLLRSETLQMTRRPRRFFYVPPVDWQAIPSGLTANWYPLDFPRNQTTIAIPPAMPFEGSPERAVQTALAAADAGLTVESVAHDELTAASGTRGSCVQLRGHRAGKPEPIYRELAVFAVAPYLYRMRLESSNAGQILELHDIFRSVASSFRPLPSLDEARLGRAFAARPDLFDHWAS